MPNPGTLAAALAHLPAWWAETTDPADLDRLLAEWAAASGWKACGFAWPADGPAVVRTVRAGALVDEPAPAGVAEILRRLRGGDVVPAAGGRVFATAPLPGRPAGVVWAERAAATDWADADRAYLALAAKTIGRSAAVAAVAGPAVDPDRLAQRLGDAAVIAGRIGHDFNNILTGIIGFSDLVLPTLQPGTPTANFVAEIGKVGQRGIRFVQELHQFSRSGQPKPGAAGVAAAVAAEAERLAAEVGSGVGFDADLPPDLPAAAVDAGVLRTVLGHLMANAAEASPAGGRVRVCARTVTLSEADAQRYLGRAAAGPHLAVTVTDAGPGIPPEVRRRLFAEPFSTTKVRHRGLGLAVAYRALAAHRGGLLIEPVPPPGTGTLVRVVLPTAAARPPAAAGGVRQPPAGR
ncbi:MAG: hypothetical protein C0501_10000 [Isosphaera sp.]|nr:hypothetical protein [Isosphaera sp.]